MKNKKNVTLILSILMLITISFSGCAYVGSEVNELNGSITGNGNQYTRLSFQKLEI